MTQDLSAPLQRLIEQAFKAGYHCRWHKDQGYYCFDPAMSPGDPDGAFRAWQYTADGSAVLAALSREAERPAPPQGWQPIETAPTGSWPNGPNDTRDPAYIEPPHLWLMLDDGEQCVGYFDAYYAEGGNGYDGNPPWVERFSSERVRPTHWMPLTVAASAHGSEPHPRSNP
jgi:hypothetical protein